MIPEKLYGREGEINTVLGAFERVLASGKPELVLVSGYSGSGKSSVVNELHKVLIPPVAFSPRANSTSINMTFPMPR